MGNFTYFTVFFHFERNFLFGKNRDKEGNVMRMEPWKDNYTWKDTKKSEGYAEQKEIK